MPLDKPVLPQWRDFKKKGIPRGFQARGPEGEDLILLRKEIIHATSILFDISKARKWPAQRRHLVGLWHHLLMISAKFKPVNLNDLLCLRVFSGIAYAQTSNKLFISALFPQLAMQLRRGLFAGRKWKLIAQIEDLRVERLCGCDSSHCASMYVYDRSRKPWSKADYGIHLFNLRKGIVTLTIVRETIRYVEILSEPAFRQRLLEAVRAINKSRGNKHNLVFEQV